MTETVGKGEARGLAPCFRIEILKKRSEFLNAATGRRVHCQGLTMLHRRAAGEHAPLRFGFTVTKKVGTATERNRIRRRLREAVRQAGCDLPDASGDYVLIGRREALGVEFVTLTRAIHRAVLALSVGGGAPARPPRQVSRS
ncbi:RnpA RNase P protein component [Rhabdaerophilaceae bacterium]